MARGVISRGKAHPGSSRWFRRYRWLVICGWLMMMLAVAWLLFFRSDKPPVAPPAPLVSRTLGLRGRRRRQDACGQAAGGRCRA
jgi:hypothetical protein